MAARLSARRIHTEFGFGVFGVVRAEPSANVANWADQREKHMPRIEFQRLELAGIVGVAVGLWLLTPAYADTVDLYCKEAGMNYGIYVSIDTSANTTTQWITGASRSGGSTQSATITSGQVTWTYTNPFGSTTFELERNTGALNAVEGTGQRHSYLCQKTSPVF